MAHRDLSCMPEDGSTVQTGGHATTSSQDCASADDKPARATRCHTAESCTSLTSNTGRPHRKGWMVPAPCCLCQAPADLGHHPRMALNAPWMLCWCRQNPPVLQRQGGLSWLEQADLAFTNPKRKAPPAQFWPEWRSSFLAAVLPNKSVAGLSLASADPGSKHGAAGKPPLRITFI